METFSTGGHHTVVSSLFAYENVFMKMNESVSRGLDVEGLEVLPALLEEGDQEVDRRLDDRDELVLSKLDFADGNSPTESLELELDLHWSSLIIAVVSSPFARSVGNRPAVFRPDR